MAKTVSKKSKPEAKHPKNSKSVAVSAKKPKHNNHSSEQKLPSTQKDYAKSGSDRGGSHDVSQESAINFSKKTKTTNAAGQKASLQKVKTASVASPKTKFSLRKSKTTQKTLDVDSKLSSQEQQASQKVSAIQKTPKKADISFKKQKSMKATWLNKWQVWQDERKKHVHLHKTFKRSFREEYLRGFSAPGLLSHAMITFKTIFKNWRTLCLLGLLMAGLYVLLVGLLNEETYLNVQTTIDDTSAELANGKIGNFAKAGLLLLSTVTTGGLDIAMGEGETMFAILLFLVLWLTVIYLLRNAFAGRKMRLRDGLFNSCGPLISTMVLFGIIFIQLIPFFMVIITYSAAVNTGFLQTPFYALLYFIFASLMLLLSGYLLSSSLIALVAVTAPGIYPIRALLIASDLMAGRRMKFIVRVIYLFFVLAAIYVITLLPVILLDLWFKNMWTWIAGWPIVPVALLLVTCFVFIYITTYVYLYYRWLLDYQEK